MASSNSNLFVFKNGWTSSVPTKQLGTGQVKTRPQSSHYTGYRKQKNLLNDKSSSTRVWKYGNAPTGHTTLN